MRRLWGLKDLLVDAVEVTTNLVQETHDSVTDKVFTAVKWVPPLEKPAALIEGVEKLTSGSVFASIRIVNRAVGELLDQGQALLDDVDDVVEAEAETEPLRLRSDQLGNAPWLRDSALGVLNGAVGDFLADRHNGLQLAMSLRHDGERLTLERQALAQALPSATSKCVLFVHGLACTDWSWSYAAEEAHGDPSVHYGTLLRDQLGFTPIYLRYNSGRHISDNGQQLAQLLQTFCSAYPGELEELVIVGHSMGGLVSRSACHYGADCAWLDKLSRVICIGSPHLGAPLEKAGNLLSLTLGYFDTPGTQVPAKIIEGRSAGIKDLRYGYITEEDWRDAEPNCLHDGHRRDIPFAEGVAYHYIASNITEDPEHPLGEIFGDTMVRRRSATGEHAKTERRIPFDAEHGVFVGGLSHLQLANHPRVYEHLRRWIADEAEPQPDSVGTK